MKSERGVIFQNVMLLQCSSIFSSVRYYPSKGSLKQLPAHIKVRHSTVGGDAESRKRKGKCKEGEYVPEVEKQRDDSDHKRLATLDIYAG